MRWKKLRNPEKMTPNEFQKAIIQNDDVKINYKKYYDLGEEIEAIDLLTNLLILSNGNLEDRLKTLFALYCFDEQSTMTQPEFVVCMEKSMRALCEIGSIQQPPINRSYLESFTQEKCAGESIDLITFKSAIISECNKFAEIFQESYRFLRTVSTIIVENPFPVISYLQMGSLFLGKYEIVDVPDVIKNISSIYKQKYKHALLKVKPMLNDSDEYTFELIYVTGIQGDKNFRQNYFREIVLKNKVSSEAITEFGELPGGLLYKRISVIEIEKMTLKEYLKRFRTEPLYSKWMKPCLSEKEVINLGLNLLKELEKLHKIGVIHSNINPTSVYLIEGNIEKLAFLDLELAIWDPPNIVGSVSPYFQQLREDMFDTTFRDEDFLFPEHKELAEEYRKTSRVPEKDIKKEGDLYSIGSLLYLAITGEPPLDFSSKTQFHDLPKDILSKWDPPHNLKDFVISNRMCAFLMKILAVSSSQRFSDIASAREELITIKTLLDSIPSELMKSLEHLPANPEIFHKDHTCDLRGFQISDFALDYLFKFVYDSKIPNLQLFSGYLPLHALKTQDITILDLHEQELFSEDLRILSLFLEKNHSLTAINLSGNPINSRHDNSKSDSSVELTLNSFIDALTKHSKLTEFRMEKVKLGPLLVEKLCKAFVRNKDLEIIQLGDTDLQDEGAKELCLVAKTLEKLTILSIEKNGLTNQAAFYLADLIRTNHQIVEIDIAGNNIGNPGALALSEALVKNFTIEKLRVDHNSHIELEENKAIHQNVEFNTHFTKIKAKYEKFKEYGYNLTAESIKSWVTSHKYAVDKLKAKLHAPADEIDEKLKEILLDSQGNLNLKPIPMKYTYNPGEGTVHFDSKIK
jgi:serine/threonine protein kinase